MGCLSPLVLEVPTAEKWEEIRENFEVKWIFPNVIESIDGEHFESRCPPQSGSLFHHYIRSSILWCYWLSWTDLRLWTLVPRDTSLTVVATSLPSRKWSLLVKDLPHASFTQKRLGQAKKGFQLQAVPWKANFEALLGFLSRWHTFLAAMHGSLEHCKNNLESACTNF